MKRSEAKSASELTGGFPRDRNLRDADWKFADILSTNAYKQKGATGRTKEDVLRRLQAFCLYEYARESYALAAWAANRDANGWPKQCEFGRSLEREWSRVYYLLMHLSSELSADTPWQMIPESKRENVLMAKLVADTPWQNIPKSTRDKVLEAQVSIEPSYFMPEPRSLRLVHSHRLEVGDVTTWERYARDKGPKRPDVEVLAFEIDWAHATNTELANALAFWRPSHIPEPSKSGGKFKATDFVAWLRYLAVARLYRCYPAKEARELAEDVIQTLPRGHHQRRKLRWRDFQRAQRRASEIFGANFLWLEDRKNLLA